MKIHERKFRRGFLLFPVFLILAFSSFAENPDSVLKKTYERFLIFYLSAKSFNVDLGLLMAIVYVERISNFDWKDKALDILLANSGYNSSIGFCQVKLKTAYWIEVQLNDSSGIYWPGKQYSNKLSVSQSPKELITKLQDDSLNIMYAAAYLRIIQSRWNKSGYPIDDRADILGTLYSTGIFNPDGTERLPRNNPEANMFGRKVSEVLHLFEELNNLLIILPDVSR